MLLPFPSPFSPYLIPNLKTVRSFRSAEPQFPMSTCITTHNIYLKSSSSALKETICARAGRGPAHNGRSISALFLPFSLLAGCSHSSLPLHAPSRLQPRGEGSAPFPPRIRALSPAALAPAGVRGRKGAFALLGANARSPVGREEGGNFGSQHQPNDSVRLSCLPGTSDQVRHPGRGFQVPGSLPKAAEGSLLGEPGSTVLRSGLEPATLR